MEKKYRDKLRVDISEDRVGYPLCELLRAIECLDKKDDQIVELNAEIDRLRKTSEEMVLIQTKRIRALEGKR